jgi:hypothetical protein
VGGLSQNAHTSIWAIGRQWVNGQNIDFEEWLVWRKIYFSHRRTTFTALLLVDSNSLHPHTHPYHHQAPPKKVVEAKGLTALWTSGKPRAREHKAECKKAKKRDLLRG